MSVFHNNALIGSGAGAADTAVEGPIKSLRFNSGDSAYLDKTFSSVSNRRTWTWAGWVKRCKSGNTHCLFFAGTSNNTLTRIIFDSDGLNLQQYDSGSQVMRVKTNALFRDPSAWYHIVAAVDTTQSTASDRVNLYVNGVLQTSFESETYPSQNLDTYASSNNKHSIGVEDAPGGSKSYFLDGYLADVYFIDGSQLNCTAFGAFDSNGVWQSAAYSGTFGTNGFHLLDFENESTIGHDSSGNNNDFTENNLTALNTFSTNMSPSSTAYDDTTLSNGGLTWSGNVANDTGTVSSLTIPTNKKTYVEVTHTSTGGGNPGPGVANGPTVEMGLDNVKAWWRGGTDGSVAASTLGSFSGTNTSWSNGDVLGIALDHTANSGNGSITFYKNGTQIHTGGSGWTSYTNLRFEWQNNGTGTSSGTWNYGASSFSYPVSGHTGLFESTSLENVLFDVPTNGTQSDTGAGGEVSGNYATLNPVAPHGLTLSNGNLDGSGSVIQGHAPSTIFASSGKFYCEFTLTTYQNDTGVGVAASIANPDEDWIGEQAYTVGYLADGRVFQNSSSTSYSSYAADDVIGAAFDVATGKVWFHKNGTYLNSGDPAAGTGQVGTITGGYALGFTFRSVGGAGSFNFGAKSFVHSAPSGFKALCTTNLPTPTIADGSTAFGIRLWTGDTNPSRALPGLNMAPDLLWFKRRSTAYDHYFFDSVRGNTKELKPNTNAAEGTTSNKLISFDSAGFTIGNAVAVNALNETYVAWAWDAGSSTVSNTDGSITSSVRANTTAGFSIVTATQGSGTSTWGHGLNTKPDLIIMKARGQAFNWYVSHSALDNQSTKFLRLNLTDGVATNANWFNSTEPTNSVVSTKAGGMWTQGDDFVAYCFSAVPGYSAFGSYTGNGNSSSGTFVFCGFRPRWVLIKATSISGQSWYILDAARDPHNLTANKLEANSANAENASPNTATTNSLDLLSNGFKLRTSNDGTNQSNATYIYYAVAENPFQANGGLAR